MAGHINDPFFTYRFSVEIDSNVVASFSDVSGLSFETDVETFREGGNNGSDRQLPGAAKASGRLILKRGLGRSMLLWNWFNDVAVGTIRRKDVSVLLIDTDDSGAELRRWRFLAACPVKWSGPELHAKTSEVAIESVEFVHRGQADLVGAR